MSALEWSVNLVGLPASVDVSKSPEVWVTMQTGTPRTTPFASPLTLRIQAGGVTLWSHTWQPGVSPKYNGTLPDQRIPLAFKPAVGNGAIAITASINGGTPFTVTTITTTGGTSSPPPAQAATPVVGTIAYTARPAPTPADRVIYVDSAAGIDTRDGLSAATAVKTIARAKSLKPAQLLLACGGMWREELDGISGTADRPAYIGDYGAGPRPCIVGAPGRNAAVFIWRCSNLIIQGIKATGARMGFCLRDVVNVVLEDCEATGNYYGVNVDVDATNRNSNITILGNVIHDNFTTTANRSQGIFIGATDGCVIEDNVIDRNGWHPATPICGPLAPENHNVYIHEENTGIVFRNNISSRPGAHALLLRCGGRAEGNVIIDAPIGIDTGGSNCDVVGNFITGDAPLAGGVAPGANGKPQKIGWPIRFGSASGSITGNFCGPQPNPYEPIIEVVAMTFQTAASAPQSVTVANNGVWDVVGKAYNRQANRTTINDVSATTVVATASITVPADFVSKALLQRRLSPTPAYTAAALIGSAK